MYTREFWDEIYQKHFTDAPWMSPEWAQDGTRLLENYIPPAPPAGCILDYGCGNALISEHFMHKGHSLELAEISDELVKWLTSQHKDVPIYLVNSPSDIDGKNKYDFVIAWGLFHHINPNMWGSFLEDFHRLMKKEALLFISGWDDSDSILKNEKKLGRFTRQRVWYINMLDDIITWRKNEFDLMESRVIPFKLNAFPQERMIRFIVARNK